MSDTLEPKSKQIPNPFEQLQYGKLQISDSKTGAYPYARERMGINNIIETPDADPLAYLRMMAQDVAIREAIQEYQRAQGNATPSR